MAWTNSDGLRVKFGTEEAIVSTVGQPKTAIGAEQVVELDITLASLGTAAAIQDNDFIFPTGTRITRVRVINTKAATGSGATLNLGFQRLDRSTELDYDGLLAAAPRTDFDAVGEIKEYSPGVTGSGALVGTTLANPGYITADYDTAAFTDGNVKIQVYFTKL